METNQGNRDLGGNGQVLLPTAGAVSSDQVLSYALNSFERVSSRFKALDSKASQGIAMVSVVASILVFAVPKDRPSCPIASWLIGVAVVLLIFATLSSLLCLTVRHVIDPPAVSSVVKWAEERPPSDLERELKVLLIAELADSERSYDLACESKARFLAAGQVLLVGGVILLLAYFVFTTYGIC